ncbi:hypothetical protein [Secundilactobacillus collinoides]|uniref:Uncharacterized protein n=1 Tax=Secundilactobacillus collinoides TaxID=33960 RepID=A0A161VIR7_SECCO|nr:hypothetical protein [Secundilactobacillus collinoides]KZL41400.1 hypothetical protein TY91_06455 [Secundilactobacillus collinoides]
MTCASCQNIILQTLATFPDLELATLLVSNHVGLTFSIIDTVNNQNLLTNDSVNIYQMPKNLLQIDTGISFNNRDDPAVQKFIELIWQDETNAADASIFQC